MEEVANIYRIAGAESNWIFTFLWKRWCCSSAPTGMASGTRAEENGSIRTRTVGLGLLGALQQAEGTWPAGDVMPQQSTPRPDVIGSRGRSRQPRRTPRHWSATRPVLGTVTTVKIDFPNNQRGERVAWQREARGRI